MILNYRRAGKGEETNREKWCIITGSIMRDYFIASSCVNNDESFSRSFTPAANHFLSSLVLSSSKCVNNTDHATVLSFISSDSTSLVSEAAINPRSMATAFG